MDRREKLETCLTHLSDLTYDNYNVILVDSGDDASVVETVPDLPVEYVSAPPRGLPNARNRGLEHCDGDIVAFLDDDAYVEENWLNVIVDEFKDEEIGGVGGPVLDPGESLRSVTPVAEIKANGEIVDNFDSSVRSHVDHLRGANMSFRRSVLTDIGGFDEGFGQNGRGRAHFEDTDVSHRVKQAGYELVYTPNAPVVHDHGFRGSASYHEWRLWNWPRLYSRLDHGPVDVVDFLIRFLVRCLWFSIQTKKLLFGGLRSLLTGPPPVKNSARNQ